MIKSNFIIVLLMGFVSLYAEGITMTKGAIRTSYESVEISPNEDMGLVGLSYLLEPNDNFYFGASLYGTVDGERGGFFVGGLTAGLKYPIYKKLYLDSGAFVGGGGGGSAPQGGGLMLKGYLGGLYEFNSGYSLGLNYSYITFPNGDIDSKQISVVADIKFETLFVDTPLQKELLRDFSFSDKQDYLVGTFQVYMPKSGTLKRSGTPLDQNIQLMGVEYGLHISDAFIAYIESAGALGGDSTGYMEVLGGVGYSKEFLKDTSLDIKASLGSAGGGEVDTGGGAVGKTSIGVHYDIGKSLTTGISAGYYHAFEGDFDASFAKLQVGINTGFLSISKKSSFYEADDFASQKFNIRITNQTYFYDSSLNVNDTGEDVQLLGVKLDWFLSDNFYITGQGFGAYKGGAGGYATGAFGAGYILPLVYDFSCVVEADIGAAGGGGIQTGSGSIVQAFGGGMYAISKDVSVEVLYGKTLSLDGLLEVNTLEFSLVYRFDKLIFVR